jgi:hypothetical protein
MSSTPRLSRLAPGKKALLYIVQQAEWACTDVKKRKSVALTGFRNLDRPAFSESLYWPYYRPIGFQDLEDQNSRQSAQDGGKIISSKHPLPLPTRKYIWF